MSDAPDSLRASARAALAPPAFDANALRVLRERYFAKKADGTTETPTEFVWRVADAIAQPESAYAAKLGRDPAAVVSEARTAFYDMMARRDFMPNTPCLVNAGRPLSMLSACFVLPVPDSIDGIFYSLKAMALIQKSGGGTGFAFSDLRHQGAEVESTGKDASGPVSFMKVFNSATDSIKQGGVRRGANMGVLRVDHPDVFHFMSCKKELDAENRALWNRLSDTGRYTPSELAHIKQELLQTQINNFNISIGVTDEFMRAVRDGTDFALRDTRTKAVVREVKARAIWDAIIEGAWQNGEPGVLFLDHPQANPLPGLGPIAATNPCVTGDTWVHTFDGPQRVAALVGRPFGAVVDGRPFASTTAGFFFSGLKEVFALETECGARLTATRDHKIMTLGGADERVWKALGDLEPGERVVVHRHAGFEWHGRGTFEDGVQLGAFVAGGVARYPSARAHYVANRTASRVRERVRMGGEIERACDGARQVALRTPSAALGGLVASFGIAPERKSITSAIEAGSHQFYRGFLRAWFDGDAAVASVGSDADVRLASARPGDLRAAGRMLARLGIESRIERPDRSRGTRTCRRAAHHELTIPRGALARFANCVGFSDTVKAARLQVLVDDAPAAAEETPGSRSLTVRSITSRGLAPVYDCTVPGPHAFDANGMYVANCGEQFLHGWDSCNLGSINVGHFYDARAQDVDWARLAQTTALAIRFLDNVIDANVYPLDEIKEMVTNNRRVGLGIMGFAELLIHKRVAYGSAEAVAFAETLMAFIQNSAEETSELLARERGDFPNKHLSQWAHDSRPRRNAALLSIAPTGTISMIAGCAFGCEPYFGMAYTKHVMKDAEGRPQHLYYVVPLFEEVARAEGFYSEDLLAKIEENRGSVRGLAEVPQRWQAVFTTSADVTVDQHVDMLAAFQKNTCNAVSKTINAPNDDTRENVARAIFRAYEAGCKGFTYYRDGSRTEQVVTFSKEGDLAGGNRDVAAAAGTKDQLDIDALLAKANALLEVR
ncbi:MAG: ribonucleoside reductase class II [Candidatus Eremiobacteraeota bacterium]|nr:ribonucleoside reductase class II [Candidatus Eremiobacteraeota bacterium]